MAGELAPEYGALKGMTMEWTDADIDADRRQRASMDAQRTAAATPDVEWTTLTSSERQILTAVEKGTLSPEQATLAFATLERTTSL